MNKNCSQCGAGFEITADDIRLSKKFDVEPPDLCFSCDQKWRLSFRNERTLYTRKCDATGENIVSIYAPDGPSKVYKHDYWYGDKWDPLEYGMDFDFNKTFFEQFRELHDKVPRMALVNLNSENSDYCNMAVGNKNCYLVFGGDFNQDCMYGTLCMHNRDSLDLDYSDSNELCYMMDNSAHCYDCQFVWDSKNCNNCAFVSDCIGCSECILSFNLKNKSYCIENRQYTKEEYLKRKSEILNGGYSKQLKNWKKFLDLRNTKVAKYAHTISCENCSGDYLKNSKNCRNCFDVWDSEDIRDAVVVAKAKDGYRVSLMGEECELTHNSIAMSGAKNIRFSYFVLNSFNVDCSEQIIGSHDIFGCNGLHRKKYCILNKQYGKEQYVALREKIIGHMKKTGEWGSFFPKDFSCFAYNEATGMRYFPLSKEQAVKEGFSWKEEEAKNYNVQSCRIPDSISDVTDDIMKEVLACEVCIKNFKIVPYELDFYRKKLIPVPHRCPDCRQKERISLRNPPRLYDRGCAKCGVGMQTTYAPDRSETVYCEKCYHAEVF